MKDVVKNKFIVISSRICVSFHPDNYRERRTIIPSRYTPLLEATLDIINPHYADAAHKQMD